MVILPDTKNTHFSLSRSILFVFRNEKELPRKELFKIKCQSNSFRNQDINLENKKVVQNIKLNFDAKYIHVIKSEREKWQHLKYVLLPR